MPGETPTARGKHETTLAPGRLRPQTTDAGTAAPPRPRLVVRKEKMLWDSGLNPLPLRCFYHFRSQPVGSAVPVPKPSFLASLSSCLTCLDSEPLAQGLAWPLPGLGGPQRHFALAPRVCTFLQTPNTHVSAQSCSPTEEGEGVRETWQSSREPRPLFTAVDLQLEGIKGREGRAGQRRQAPPSSYLPAASTLLLPPKPGNARGGLLPLPLMSGNCLLSWGGGIR